MTEHTLQVGHATSDGWFTVCSCGWTSTGHPREWWAQVAADIHEREVGA